MVITWYGENCFKLQSGQVTIMTDPPAPSSGLKQPRFKYDILLKSLSGVPVERPEEDDSFAIVGPGEYEIKKMLIRGFPLAEESGEQFLKTAYLINDGELVVCFLGHISDTTLDPRIMESLSEIDVLILPGGGSPYISQENAAKLANQIEPAVIIPSCFKVTGLKRKADDIKQFLQELGSTAKPEEKVTIKKRDLDPEETQVAVLKPS